MLREALRRLFMRRSAQIAPPVASARPDSQPVERSWQQELLLLHLAPVGEPIRIADHCYGCTAGQGSSCGGALGGEEVLADGAALAVAAGR